jgi:CBS-domain-containing membrane protein
LSRDLSRFKARSYASAYICLTELVDQIGQALLIGSFGTTAVLVYGAIRSPLAQPRNVLGGMFFPL